jgi:hypothetical protein
MAGKTSLPQAGTKFLECCPCNSRFVRSNSETPTAGRIPVLVRQEGSEAVYVTAKTMKV